MDIAAITHDPPDSHFRLTQIPAWRANCYRFLSVHVWGKLPGHLQRSMSAFYARLYEKSYSRYIIKPYIQFHYNNSDYLDRFMPPEGKREYESFQDFFIRRFAAPPSNNDPFVWPCEGLLCDCASVKSLSSVQVKCDRRNIATIFGVDAGKIPGNYHFTNVFLHNKNYHRIHAPVAGKIVRIQHIPGDLVVLRPWIYKQDPSLPAFRNERYNIDIEDKMNRTWHLSIIGGPAVGTIALPENIAVGNQVNKLEELALFYLGSTCCMAAPESPRYHKKNSFVEVGITY
ncbi:MAG: phosphatidylserine decarboxylase [Eudoraea sp.]|nr:phosphatidylserine decarboxylase [Eudoraea sp.]